MAPLRAAGFSQSAFAGIPDFDICSGTYGVANTGWVPHSEYATISCSRSRLYGPASGPFFSGPLRGRLERPAPARRQFPSVSGVAGYAASWVAANSKSPRHSTLPRVEGSLTLKAVSPFGILVDASYKRVAAWCCKVARPGRCLMLARGCAVSEGK